LPKTVPSSDYLREKRADIERLVEELGRHFPYASVLGTDVEARTFEVSNLVTAISDGMWGERGFVVRVYSDGRFGEFAFDDLPDTAAGLAALAGRIVESVRAGAGKGGIAHPCPVEEPLVKAFNDSVELLPGDIAPDDAIVRLSSINKRIRARSPEIIEVRVAMSYAKVSKIFVSAKRNLEQNYVWSSGFIGPSTRRGDVTRQAFKTCSGMKGLEILDEMGDLADGIADVAVALLDAGSIEPGEYDVICSPGATGMIVHEAFGHGVELDMFLRDRAKAREYMGKPVASPIVNMRDGAASARHVSSFLFDDEGNLGSDTLVIENGILRAGISDALSAARLGLAPTGNGKRERFDHKAYSRMTNTFFEPGTDSLDDMIASIDRGWLIENATSGMEDPKDWGIQCLFTFAREIVGGRLTGRLVSPVVMSGYVPELLGNITMVSGDVRLSGSGACGKGYKEYVKVSSGGPYIKTKARLG